MCDGRRVGAAEETLGRFNSVEQRRIDGAPSVKYLWEGRGPRSFLTRPSARSWTMINLLLKFSETQPWCFANSCKTAPCEISGQRVLGDDCDHGELSDAPDITPW